MTYLQAIEATLYLFASAALTILLPFIAGAIAYAIAKKKIIDTWRAENVARLVALTVVAIELFFIVATVRYMAGED